MSDFIPVSSEAVVQVDNKHKLTATLLFKPGDLIEEMGLRAVGSSKVAEKAFIFNEGIPCKLMEPGGDWKQGKLRFRLEFAADD